ncbi:MAG: NAD(P)/FAD-dependent oxidoreductase [Polaromonas sp.]|uniref:NAD(P)/FAD-dependent oxidoreductase n=1 Tax=Polaromonas sp. TaxID=1869339 RepID=UPI0027184A80|nr:NAD(P)/FAD-dependent oxidoreductase [Polaromonas sp.]MDO9112631.1 NAD(P)/FAD-dependent oxidoreductase [Polaromonas sp.]MDP1887272.1 NAD(P)/FAD-dependent oxidoreductase [Polaromonas sp.]
MTHKFDVVVVGAGAAGLFCAGLAGQRGLKVLLVDHSEKVAEKIRISGGGRCNFTNRDTTPANFLSENPHFCRSALSRYTPQDFIALLHRHGIPFHEKHKGQLFCDRSAEDIITLLLAECDAGGVTRWQPCRVSSIKYDSSPHGTGAGSYQIESDRGHIEAPQLVIATGGLSIPKIGATDFGYRIAKQFGLRLVEPRAALVPLTFDGEAWAPYAQLAGLALPVRIETGPPDATPKQRKKAVVFAEDLLFTHRGLSGPAVLQISSFWREGQPVRINLAPGMDLPNLLLRAKASSKKLIANELAALVPARLADAWVSRDPAWQKPVSEATDKALTTLADRLADWQLTPTGTEGYKKAEVTLGGVDTRDLSSQTMESKQPGLYFIGEVVDVTGWLGGYNFQWAWASAHACAEALAAKSHS